MLLFSPLPAGVFTHSVDTIDAPPPLLPAVGGGGISARLLGTCEKYWTASRSKTLFVIPEHEISYCIESYELRQRSVFDCHRWFFNCHSGKVAE